MKRIPTSRNTLHSHPNHKKTEDRSSDNFGLAVITPKPQQIINLTLAPFYYLPWGAVQRHGHFPNFTPQRGLKSENLRAALANIAG